MSSKFKRNELPIFPFPQEKDEKELKTEFHTLFIEEEPETQVNLEDDDGPIPDVFMMRPGYTMYKFYVGDFSENGTDLHPIMNKLGKANSEDLLELHIDSNGGSVTEGKLFFNIVNNIFEKENVAAFVNSAYSMGAILFGMCDIRVCHEFSDLMYHDYSSFNYGKAGEMETSHNHNSKHLRNFFKRFTLDKGFLTQEEFEQLLIGKDFWMDTKEMCERGICTHVQTAEGMIKAEAYLESLNPKPVETKPKAPRKPKAKVEESPAPTKTKPAPKVKP